MARRLSTSRPPLADRLSDLSPQMLRFSPGPVSTVRHRGTPDPAGRVLHDLRFVSDLWAAGFCVTRIAPPRGAFSFELRPVALTDATPISASALLGHSVKANRSQPPHRSNRMPAGLAPAVPIHPIVHPKAGVIRTAPFTLATRSVPVKLPRPGLAERGLRASPAHRSPRVRGGGSLPSFPIRHGYHSSARSCRETHCGAPRW
jgi:hypothetical protein